MIALDSHRRWPEFLRPQYYTLKFSLRDIIIYTHTRCTLLNPQAKGNTESMSLYPLALKTYQMASQDHELWSGHGLYRKTYIVIRESTCPCLWRLNNLNGSQPRVPPEQIVYKSLIWTTNKVDHYTQDVKKNTILIGQNKTPNKVRLWKLHGVEARTQRSGTSAPG